MKTTVKWAGRIALLVLGMFGIICLWDGIKAGDKIEFINLLVNKTEGQITMFRWALIVCGSLAVLQGPILWILNRIE